jgi:polysaccharide biosynthesis/export protein
MFQTEKEFPASAMQEESRKAELNYKLQVNDFITAEVYTNNGELIIDPDFELMRGMQAGGGGPGVMGQQRKKPQYLVQANGMVKLPVIGEIKLEGLTLREAEKIMEREYEKFYKNSFVIAQFINKRVIILGDPGGVVVPLLNENMNLIEVIALAGGITFNGKAQNIRLIRGDLSNPEVHLIDLSTIEGMQKSTLTVYSGDIIYIEPIRRTLIESTRDVAPLIGAFTSILTLVVLLSNLTARN